MPGVLVLDPVQLVGDAGSNLLAIDSAGRVILPDGAATEATLATLATETKLEAVRVLLASIDGKDFATEATLSTLATESKLEAVRVLLASLDSKDFATETTLELVRLLLVSLDGKDFATESTLELVRLLLVSLDGKDFATATNQVNRDQAAQAIGDVAHNDVDSGEPVKIGGTATATSQTAVDDGDRVQASFDLQGRQRQVVEDSDGDQLSIENDGAISALKEIQDVVDTRPRQFSHAFTDEKLITVTHSLGKYPLNVTVLSLESGIGGFGFGGYGEGGFGEFGGEVDFSSCLGQMKKVRVIHCSENEFRIILERKRTGKVLYWV